MRGELLAFCDKLLAELLAGGVEIGLPLNEFRLLSGELPRQLLAASAKLSHLL